MSVQFIRFLIVGCVNTFACFAVIFGVKILFGLGDIVANVLGYVVGLVVSFLLNRRWTFQHDGPVMPVVVRFVCVFAIAYVTNLGTVLTLIEWGGVNSYMAQAYGGIVYTATFFFLSRVYAFRSAPSQTATTP